MVMQEMERDVKSAETYAGFATVKKIVSLVIFDQEVGNPEFQVKIHISNSIEKVIEVFLAGASHLVQILIYFQVFVSPFRVFQRGFKIV